MSLLVSLIVTTYNWPKALNRVLKGVALQSYPQLEVIVADDGSKEETALLIQSFRDAFPFPLIHCWQPDDGFRAAMCRNKAVAKAKGDYIIFIDGDCVPLPDFVSRHVKLAKRGWFVAGNRVLLTKDFTQKILEEDIPIESYGYLQWANAFIKKQTNRLVPTQYLPLGMMRSISQSKWQGAKTCNLGVWKQDYIAVNGLDENFVGWGFEDSDLIIRLQRFGIRRTYGKYATEVIHLWHQESNREQMITNKVRLEKTIQSTHVKAALGIEQYI